MNAVTKEPQNQALTKIPEYTQTELALIDLSKRYSDIVFDVSTPAGMKAAKAARSEIKDYRVILEKTRVAVKEDALNQCRLIDSEAKRIKESLEALEHPIDQQIKAEEKRKEEERIAAENAEMERVKNIQQRIIDIRNQPAFLAAKSSTEIRDALVIVTELEITTDQYAEFIDHAQAAKAEAMTALAKMTDDAERLEAERAELARLRQEAEARAQEEAKRKAEAERLEAEQRAKEQADLQAERERFAKERAEHEAKMQAEREAAAKAEAERQRAIAEENARRAEEQAEIQRREAALRQAEAEAKAEQARLEQEKLEAEKRAQAEAERMEAEQADYEAKMKAMEDEVAVLLVEIASGGLSVEDALRCAYVAGENAERSRHRA